MLYCLGNNDKKKNTYLFSTDVMFKNVVEPQLVESMDKEPTDMEGQFYRMFKQINRR